MNVARVVARGAQLRLHLGRGQAEQEEVLGADGVADLDVGAVERADRERAVQRELHVAGARRLLAGRRDLQRDVGGRDDRLRQRHAVVRHEDHREPPAHRRVGVDDRGDVVDQPDVQLGHDVAGRGLAREDVRARRVVGAGVALERQVVRDDLQAGEQLALVLVDALDLHDEHRVGRQLDARAPLDERRRGRACSAA